MLNGGRKKEHGPKRGLPPTCFMNRAWQGHAWGETTCTWVGQTSSEERHLVCNPAGNTGSVKGGGLMTKRRSGFSFAKLGSFVSFSAGFLLLSRGPLSVGKIGERSTLLKTQKNKLLNSKIYKPHKQPNVSTAD